MEHCFGDGWIPCPYRDILLSIPLLIFWIGCPLSLWRRRGVEAKQKLTTIFGWRILVIVLLLLVESYNLFIRWNEPLYTTVKVTSSSVFNFWEDAIISSTNAPIGEEHSIWTRIYWPIFGMLTYLGMMALLHFDAKRGTSSNAVISLCFTLLLSLNFSAFVIDCLDGRALTSSSFDLPLTLILMAAETGLLAVSDGDKKEEESPEEHASFLSNLFFCWLLPPIIKGSRRPLTTEDVFPIRKKWTSEYLKEQWNREWSRSLEEHARRQKKVNEKGTVDKDAKADYPSIIWPLIRIFRWKLFSVTGMRFIADFVHFSNPVLLRLLIDFVSDDSSPISYGIAIAIGMFALSEIRSLLFNHFFTVMITTSIQVQSVLTNAIFAKSLRLSASARNGRTVGAIVNLMAIDVEKIGQVMPITQHYWSSPLQLSIAMGLLWWTIGPAAIAGIAVMLLMIPVNYFSSIRIKNWQLQQMKVKDERTKMCNEVLNGIRLIKLYAWEEAFEKKINELREQEVRFLRKMGLLSRIVDASNAAAPFVVAVASFSLFVLSDERNVLTPQIAFVCLTIFNQIRQPMRIVAMLINHTVQAMVSNGRLKEFMSAEERSGVDFATAEDTVALEMSGTTWGWKIGQSDLVDINFRAKTGSLTAIVGSVGSGKSSLLSAVIGEMELVEGKVSLAGRIAYVPQQAWLMNATVRENILFGKEYDQNLYNQITTACELTADFKMLPNGDATPVGENGVTLSGGQKARLSLARALYQEVDIYLFDDPLSAVDAHVGEAIYEQVIGPTGLLRNQTRILVTHGLQYTKQAEEVLVMKEGRIIQKGTFQELEKEEGAFAELLREKSKEEQTNEDESETEHESCSDEESVATLSRRSEGSKRSGKEKMKPLPEKNIERVETGKVKLDVWWSLIRAATLRYCIPFILFYVVHFAFQVSRNLWLSDWSDSSTHGAGNEGVGTRLSVYTALGLMEVGTICFAFHFLVLACQQASLNLHGPMLRGILRSPMHFFDQTPIGRILNRLSRELDVIDVNIPMNVRQFVNNMLQVVAIIFVISYSTPLFIIAIVPLAALYFFLLKFYIPTARQLRRLESVARSPILSVFAESVHGVTSIRAYDKVESSCDAFSLHVDHFSKTKYSLMVVNRWLAIHLELFGNLVVLFAAFFAVISSRHLSVSPGLIGLSVSYALTITEMMNMAIRMLSEMETNAVSVERVREYSMTESEAPWYSPMAPSDEWPEKPSIDCTDVSLRYRSDLPLVLHGLDAHIKPGEKIAIVGRTGSGKSSFTLALFRMVEPSSGSIVLGGIDTSRLGLHELRSKLAIIPQEPVLFSGTLRFNLDPFGQYSDEELWKTLEMCQLKEFASMAEGQLEYRIAEGGKNISVGQRQLLCLARVLLKRAKVLVLDEATASVDVVTDSLVQSVVREEFAKSTVIAIAHRLNTIAGYDRIMVLEKGCLVEFDTPARLLADKTSRYSRMLEKSRRAEMKK